MGYLISGLKPNDPKTLNLLIVFTMSDLLITGCGQISITAAFNFSKNTFGSLLNIVVSFAYFLYLHELNKI